MADQHARGAGRAGRIEPDGGDVRQRHPGLRQSKIQAVRDLLQADRRAFLRPRRVLAADFTPYLIP